MQIPLKPRGVWPRRAPGRTRTAVRVILAAIVAVLPLLPTPSPGAPSQAELERARARLMEIERDFEIVVEEYNAVNEHLAEIQAQMGVAALEIRRLQKRMNARRETAVATARQLYKAGPGATIEAVLSSESLADIQVRLEYLRSSQSAQTKVFEHLSADQRELDGKLGDLDEQRKRAQEDQARLGSLKADVEARIASQQDEVDTLVAQIEAAEARQARGDVASAASTIAPILSSAPVPKVTASNPRAQTAVDAALSQVGKPYQWGASGPNSYDCSGLTMWAWAQAGVSLPHNSGAQYAATARVASSNIEPGDLLFFGSPIHHVGMYIGGGRMVAAPYSGQTVWVTSSSRSDFVGAGRPGV